MYILGLVGGTRIGYQDASATLVKNGVIVQAMEEERILRQRHAAGHLPDLAIHSVLQSEGITIQDIDYVYFHGSTWAPDYRGVLTSFLQSKFGFSPPVDLIHHHDAHLASAYYGSGFNESMVLSLDLSGDGCSTSWAIGKDSNLEIIDRYERPRSLGIFYAAITEYCGFNKYSDEYKLMGLSSYGDNTVHDFSWFLPYENGSYDINLDYIMGFKEGQASPAQQIPLYSPALVKKLGQAPRISGSPMTAFYENVAASAQKHLEDAVVDIVTTFHNKTGLRKLCLAGGVALNVVVNQRLMNLDFIDDIYVQPASNDTGISVGAAYLGAKIQGDTPRSMTTAYLGTEWKTDEIEDALKMTGAPYQRVDDTSTYAAKAVAANKVVGWFQGRMELGPRALGNRSILANPCNKNMQDIVNMKVKFREEFRPFCPSVLEEDLAKHFIGKAKTSPYMTITYDVNDDNPVKLPSITHVDNTARIQSVNAEQNDSFYRYLRALKNEIGVGVTMNTSFNVKGDPIVNTPYQALGTFYGSGMNTLIMGDFVVEK